MSVRLVSMLCDEVPVDTDVEFAVGSGYEGKRFYLFSPATESITRHPGGSRGVPSRLAIFDFNT